MPHKICWGCDIINKKVGIPKALLYYYYKDLWIEFFKKLDVKVVTSNQSTKKTLEDGTKIAPDEACLSLKLFLGHIISLQNKCDYILVPRMFSVEKKEQVCTNFNALYDLVNNLFSDIEIIDYNVDLTTGNNEVLAFLNLGEQLGFSYIKSYKAYKYAKKISSMKRKKEEEDQEIKLKSNKLKILLASHPYNLYDDLVGTTIKNYLEKENIEIICSNKIKHKIINQECDKLSTDIHWTHSKEVVASVNYYKDKVDGIILISSFPCGPDSLSNELICRKVKNIPVITLIFENLNSEVGIITRLESFIDILKNIKEHNNEKDN